MNGFKITRFNADLEKVFEGKVMTISEVHLQESINLKKLCKYQQKHIISLLDLITLQRQKIKELNG